MKRFWNTVAVAASEDGHAILIDGKPVRTPGRLPLALPNPALAEAVAEEWRAVADEIRPADMPLTGLANAAIERIAPDPAAFADGLARYAETDLLCYRAESPATLVERQAALWDPLIVWAQARYDVHFVVASGIVHRQQLEATLRRMAAAVAALSPWQLAALSPIVTITGSLIAGLALADGGADAETVWRAGELDSDWQAEHWGEDPLATAARDSRRADFDSAARFLALLR